MYMYLNNVVFSTTFLIFICIQIIMAVTLSPKDWHQCDKLEKFVSKLGLVYGIVAQNRCHMLSAVQRVVSLEIYKCLYVSKKKTVTN